MSERRTLEEWAARIEMADGSYELGKDLRHYAAELAKAKSEAAANMGTAIYWWRNWHAIQGLRRPVATSGAIEERAKAQDAKDAELAELRQGGTHWWQEMRKVANALGVQSLSLCAETAERLRAANARLAAVVAKLESLAGVDGVTIRHSEFADGGWYLEKPSFEWHDADLVTAIDAAEAAKETA